MHVYAIIRCVLNRRSLVFSYPCVEHFHLPLRHAHKNNDTNKDQNFFAFFAIIGIQRIGDTKSINR